MSTLSDPTTEDVPDGLSWTTANTGEAAPGVLTPLAWTVWRDQLELGARQSYLDLGIMEAEQVVVPPAAGDRHQACFYGRMAANIDVCARTFSALSGDVHAQLFSKSTGIVTPTAAQDAGDRQRRRAQAEQTFAPTLVAYRAAQFDWWTAKIGEDTAHGYEGARERLADAVDHFREAMRVHVVARMILADRHGALTQLVTSIGEPGLEHDLMSGYDGLEESQLAGDLWDVAQEKLPLSTFLERHGYHGPAEGNVASHSWREDPRPLQEVVTLYHQLDEELSPVARLRQSRASRERAEQRVIETLSADRREEARDLFLKTQEVVLATELGKASFVMALDVARASARSLGTGLVESGVLDDEGDVLYLTVDELTAARVPDDARALVTYRRSRHERNLRLRLPTSWVGHPTPIEEPVDRHEPQGQRTISGTAASSGVAEGRARVIIDPSVDTNLEPGEVLVAHVTDPSWVVLMIAAAAMVVDVGGPSSHAAIVARDLGIPCVIGTVDGTRRIRTGDLLRVDGSKGTVELLESGEPAP